MAPHTPDATLRFHANLALSQQTTTKRRPTIKPHRLFAIPELLLLIASFLSRKDALHLAKCSRVCFQAAVESIWCSIPDPRLLLSLFPDFLEDSQDRTGSDISESSTYSYARFDFYCSLVKHLEFCWDCFYYYTGDHLNSLLSYTERETLLPNLHRLDLSYDIVAEHLSWVTPFLSPSLLCIEGMDDSYEGLDIDQAVELFEKIALCCPTIKRLDITTFVDQSDGQVTSLPTQSVFRNLGLMQNLQSLCTNMDIFQPSALVAIGGLPQLETLHVFDNSYSEFQVAALVLPDNSFPALQKLSLPYFVIDELEAIWGIERLITRPAVVNIEINGSGDESDAASFLGNVCQRSPQIAELTFNYGGTHILPPDYFQVFEHLSLKKLSLSGIEFDLLDATCKILSLACPLLHELELIGLKVSILYLLHFTQFSRLETLKVLVDWESCFELSESVPNPLVISPILRQLDGRGYSSEFIEPELITKTVLFLLSFWPGLKSTSELHKHSIEWLINRCLRAERETRGCRCSICIRSMTSAVSKTSP
ncbi:hypothetical protein BDV93DRAFT_611173 [Ceratobasidium sp. AG-I]|nr:hypothetical protein BDV93DRAFT_611173 [Ceratobasidium sp. AG-I]